jgi:hypothetical protein
MVHRLPGYHRLSACRKFAKKNCYECGACGIKLSEWSQPAGVVSMSYEWRLASGLSKSPEESGTPVPEGGLSKHVQGCIDDFQQQCAMRKNVVGGPQPLSSWQSLKTVETLCPGDPSPAQHYQFRTANGSRADLVVADLSSGSWQIKPAISSVLEATSNKAEQDRVTAAVNGGYFSPKDGSSVSCVIIDGKVVSEPAKNRALVRSIRGHQQSIFNRSELRVLQDTSGATSLDIAPHNASLGPGYKLLHSLQSGPNLLTAAGTYDDQALTREGFIRKNAKGNWIDAIDAAGQEARTAIGITADHRMIMACVADNHHDPNSTGLTISQLAELMRSLGCIKALNLDGGSSTTMFVRPVGPNGCNGVTHGKNATCEQPERKVKSYVELWHLDPAPPASD